MDGINQYILTVTVAAVLCCIVCALTKKNKIIKLLTGIFMIITVIQPLIYFRFTQWSDFASEIYADASAAAAAGEKSSDQELRALITSRTEAYILDKANSLSLNLEVEVTLRDENPPVPGTVTLKGAASPYAKQCMMTYLCETLGIHKEGIYWK